VLNGYAGVEGWDHPNELVFMVDDEIVHTVKIGGPEDHDASVKEPIAMVAKLDERLKTRVTLSAGPHDIAVTWRERSFIRQDVWEVSQRDSQEVHFAGGLPRLRTMSVTGPFKVTGVSRESAARGVCLRRLMRAGQELPVTPKTPRRPGSPPCRRWRRARSRHSATASAMRWAMCCWHCGAR